MRWQDVARLLAREHAVEHGVAADGEIARGGVRRNSQNDERRDECRRCGAARVDDGEDAKAEQREIQDEDRDEQARVERRVREHDGGRCQHDRARQSEQDERAPVRPENELPSPGTSIDSVAAATNSTLGGAPDDRVGRAAPWFGR